MKAIHQMRSAPAPSAARRGLTLYEVVLAVGIFMMSLTVLSQSIATGGRAAVQSRLQTHAVLHCESLIAEIVAGARTPDGATRAPLEEAGPDWYWTAQVLPGPVDDLQELTVTVTYSDPQGVTTVTSSLMRWFSPSQLTGATPDMLPL